MPRLRRIGLVPKDRAIVGSAGEITVPSRFSMNNAHATISATSIGRGCEGGIENQKGRCERRLQRASGRDYFRFFKHGATAVPTWLRRRLRLSLPLQCNMPYRFG